MGKRLNTILGRGCEHRHTLVVRSVGVTRTVCEDCGHLSFKIQTGLAHMFEVEDLDNTDLQRVSGL
ncbi:MAG: hypothetical protein R3258_03470 [Acidimicrobiia bacterium]|nr:hypothetical protein [Acidimicrobiia bacterium]